MKDNLLILAGCILSMSVSVLVYFVLMAWFKPKVDKEKMSYGKAEAKAKLIAVAVFSPVLYIYTAVILFMRIPG